MVIRRTVEGELEITSVAGTERTLLLTREEAEEWLRENPDIPEEAREDKIKMLCCAD